jgi:hypothetical protein
LYVFEALDAAGQDKSNGHFYCLEYFVCDVSGIKIWKKEIYFLNSKLDVCKTKIERTPKKENINFSKFIFQ